MAKSQMLAIYNGKQFQNIVLPEGKDPFIYCAKNNYVLINIVGELNDYQDKEVKEIVDAQQKEEGK